MLARHCIAKCHIEKKKEETKARDLMLALMHVILSPASITSNERARI
jgi:hypothetical protein